MLRTTTLVMAVAAGEQWSGKHGLARREGVMNDGKRKKPRVE